MDYAIIDVETTGGKFNEESIIEIAVYRFDGEKITDTFISLVNPEKEIHFYVQKLTGITKKMVRTAPKFYELAKRLVEITEDATIVGHNVPFDYRIIRTEFSRLGFDFQRDTLDTIPLSKTLIPGMASYSLGNLCTSLGIPLSDRHRAHGDARATVQLFQLLLSKDSQKNIIQNSIKQVKHQSLNKKILQLLEDLPPETGVFYLHNENGKIIFIESSTSISNQARQILTGKSKRAKELQIKTENISFELTGSEIIANIKAQNEIKINSPVFKPRKISTPFIYGIFSDKQNKDFLILALTKSNKHKALLTFTSLEKAKIFLVNKQQETPSYEKLLSEFGLNEKQLLLIDKGRNRNEKSFLFLENGILKGYGFYTLHSQIKSVERVQKIMVPAQATVENMQQIRNKLFITENLKKVIL